MIVGHLWITTTRVRRAALQSVMRRPGSTRIPTHVKPKVGGARYTKGAKNSRITPTKRVPVVRTPDARITGVFRLSKNTTASANDTDSPTNKQTNK